MKRTKRQQEKAKAWRIVLFVAALIVGLDGMIFYFAFRRPNGDDLGVPHFFATAAMANPLPKTLDPAQFSNRYVVAAYQAAREIPAVLAQQPCYCHCDRRMGHRSLLDCFVGRHGPDCDICVKEALFAMQEHRQGRSVEQIRAKIIHGDWKTV